MPAILLECGFIHGKERDDLKDSAFLDSMAQSITAGIGTYLEGLGEKS
jgi:N-acetylmuramoyl-L-alanine amidase